MAMNGSADDNLKNAGGGDMEVSLPDLDCLNFPGEVDWSSTLVLRCDPEGGPYTLSDVIQALHDVVRRDEVFHLGPTFLHNAFTLSFRTASSMEHFVKYFTKNPRLKDGIKVKGHHCAITRVPNKCVSIQVRNIPLEIDSACIVKVLEKYGTIVKTELLKNKVRGWFHVYNNERKFTLMLKDGVGPDDIPYGMKIKGLYAGVLVEERNPKCLECYYAGHKGEECSYKGCVLYDEKP